MWKVTMAGRVLAGLMFAAGSTTPGLADDPANPTDALAAPPSEIQGENVQMVQESVDEQVSEKVDERRQKIMKEALSAVEETRSALASLEEEKPEDALAALERVTGKLELLVAREPKLALAPVDLTVTTHDLYASPRTIERTIEEVKSLLDDGEIPRARLLLDGLASEVVVSEVTLPLASYPAAIKAVAPLIDEGNLEEAKQALGAALNTMVVIDHVVPLPVLRVESLLGKADALAKKDDRTDEESAELATLLQDVGEQLELAELLGYVEDETAETLHSQMKSLEKKTKKGTADDDLFEDIKLTLANWRSSVFG